MKGSCKRAPCARRTRKRKGEGRGNKENTELAKLHGYSADVTQSI